MRLVVVRFSVLRLSFSIERRLFGRNNNVSVRLFAVAFGSNESVVVKCRVDNSSLERIHRLESFFFTVFSYSESNLLCEFGERNGALSAVIFSVDHKSFAKRVILVDDEKREVLQRVEHVSSVTYKYTGILTRERDVICVFFFLYFGFTV